MLNVTEWKYALNSQPMEVFTDSMRHLSHENIVIKNLFAEKCTSYFLWNENTLHRIIDHDDRYTFTKLT